MLTMPSIDSLDTESTCDLFTNQRRPFKISDPMVHEFGKSMYFDDAFECISGRNYSIRLFVQNHSLFESKTEI